MPRMVESWRVLWRPGVPGELRHEQTAQRPTSNLVGTRRLPGDVVAPSCADTADDVVSNALESQHAVDHVAAKWRLLVI